MREILFRGKAVESDPDIAPADGWVEGFYYQDLCGGEVKHFIVSCPCTWEVVPATVGQYTGLKDKNGKEIYEGDIMNDPTGKNVRVVEWNSILCQFQLSWQNMPTAADIFFMVKNGSLRLGNIHDNHNDWITQY